MAERPRGRLQMGNAGRPPAPANVRTDLLGTKATSFDAEPLSEAHLADQWNGRLPARRRGFQTPFLCLDCEGMVESLSARLAQMVLPEAGGGAVRLGSLWEKNPAVVVFLRHYG